MSLAGRTVQICTLDGAKEVEFIWHNHAQALDILENFTLNYSNDYHSILNTFQVSTTDVVHVEDEFVMRLVPQSNYTATTRYVTKPDRSNPYNMNMDNRESQFVNALTQMQIDIHKTAKDSGWWEDERNMGEAIALMHSELSEALEALRAGNPPDDKIPNFNGLEAELADCIIRILDVAEGFNLNVVSAIVAKNQMNKTRAYKHGKNF